MDQLIRRQPDDLDDLLAFLTRADLTLSGLDAPDVRLWLLRDDLGRVVGTTGYEMDGDQKLGFEPADRDELVAGLPKTHQVRLFQETGQLGRELAWSRPLP